MNRCKLAAFTLTSLVSITAGAWSDTLYSDDFDDATVDPRYIIIGNATIVEPPGGEMVVNTLVGDGVKLTIGDDVPGSNHSSAPSAECIRIEFSTSLYEVGHALVFDYMFEDISGNEFMGIRYAISEIGSTKVTCTARDENGDVVPINAPGLTNPATFEVNTVTLNSPDKVFTLQLDLVNGKWQIDWLEAPKGDEDNVKMIGRIIQERAQHFATKYKFTSVEVRTATAEEIQAAEGVDPIISFLSVTAEDFHPPVPSPLEIIDIALNGDPLTAAITWSSSRPGATYTVEFSNDLVSWVELDDGIAGAGETTTFTDDSVLVGREGFYRVRETN